MNRKGDWMQTFTGRQYWPLDPRADEVDPVDIVHHLSMTCRYCGAVERFYSVAEHTLGVLHVGLREAIRRNPLARHNRLISVALLLHDAAESYCHDLIRPIKRCVEGYDVIEANNYDAICGRFDIEPVDLMGFKDLVKEADNAMLLAEKSYVVNDPGHHNWAMGATAPSRMVEDGRRYLRCNARLPWRTWRWWNKREMLRQMRRVGLV